MEARVLVAVDISGSKRLTFFQDAIRYKERSIFYSDVTGVAYSATTMVALGVPYDHRYWVKVHSTSTKLDIYFTAFPLLTSNARLRDAFTRIVGGIQNLIEPLLVAKLTSAIFQAGMTLSVGKLTIERSGITENRLLGASRFLPWARVLGANMRDGFAVVWESSRGAPGQVFSGILDEVPNAVLLPSLLKSCIVAAGKGGQ